jgi:hypothetical protein
MVANDCIRPTKSVYATTLSQVSHTDLQAALLISKGQLIAISHNANRILATAKAK